MTVKIYNESISPLSPTDGNTTVIFQDTDTFGAAAEYDNPACLNFASHKRPGGGYEAVKDIPRPIKTQEEDLFRRSNLPELMDNPEVRKNYPLGNRALYTPGVVVTKDQWLKPVEPFTCAVVTVAAVVRPTHQDVKRIERKVETIFHIAAANGHKTLILGAWGCGVFHNDPRLIATLFKNNIRGKFKGVFETVVLAIPGEHTENYRIFNEVFDE